MHNYALLERLQCEMSNAGNDARAETQVAMALNEGLVFEDFMVHYDSFFYREYSKDVLFTDIKEDATKRPLLAVHLTRSGISDSLPEGLFFQPDPGVAKRQTAIDMAEEHKANNKREASVRNFFLPFENDFFWQRVQIEMEETELLQGLESGILTDYFVKFWGLPATIPETFVTPLILLLPYAHKIAGSMALTAQGLELLLKEPVEIKRVAVLDTDAGSFLTGGLGKQTLGVDAVCGQSFGEDYPVLEATIGPLRNSRVSDYLEGGERFSLLETFYSFFMPVGVDISTRLEVGHLQRNMHLNPGAEPILGHSTVL